MHICCIHARIEVSEMYRVLDKRMPLLCIELIIYGEFCVDLFHCYLTIWRIPQYNTIGIYYLYSASFITVFIIQREISATCRPLKLRVLLHSVSLICISYWRSIWMDVSALQRSLHSARQIANTRSCNPSFSLFHSTRKISLRYFRG